MDQGKLNQRIIVQRETRIPDDGGGAASAWSTYARPWAEVIPVRVRSAEQVIGGAPITVGTFQFRVRQRSDFDTTMRIAWNGQILNIRNIEDPGPTEDFMLIDTENGSAT